MTQDHPWVRPRRPSLRPDLAAARARRAGAVEDAACGTGEAGVVLDGPEHSAMLTRDWDVITIRPRRGYRPAKKP